MMMQENWCRLGKVVDRRERAQAAIGKWSLLFVGLCSLSSVIDSVSSSHQPHKSQSSTIWFLVLCVCVCVFSQIFRWCLLSASCLSCIHILWVLMLFYEFLCSFPSISYINIYRRDIYVYVQNHTHTQMSELNTSWNAIYTGLNTYLRSNTIIEFMCFEQSCKVGKTTGF